MYHFHDLPQIFIHTTMLYTGTSAFQGFSPAFLNTNHSPATVPTKYIINRMS